jgi:hypothetical protein
MVKLTNFGFLPDELPGERPDERPDELAGELAGEQYIYYGATIN